MGCKSWTDIGPVHNPNSRLPVNKAKGKTANNHTQTDQTNRAKSSSDVSCGGTAGSSCGWARYLRFSWVPLLRVACSSDLHTQPNMRFWTFGTTGAALTNSNTFASPETATPSIIAKGRFESPWASLEEKNGGSQLEDHYLSKHGNATAHISLEATINVPLFKRSLNNGDRLLDDSLDIWHEKRSHLCGLCLSFFVLLICHPRWPQVSM